jgi:hypothetical protein
MIAGDHYATFNPNMALFEDRDPNFDTEYMDKKPRMVVNHSLSVARTELAKLTKSDPIMEVVANSDSPQDIAAVRVSKAALNYVEWKFRLKKLRKNAVWWMLVGGVCGVNIGWDYLNEQAGFMSYVIDPSTGDATFNPDRKKEIQDMVDSGELDKLPEEKLPLGELEYKLYTMFQLFPDENALDFEEIRDLITTEVMDIDTLRGIYGKQVDGIMPEDTQLGVMERRMMQRIGAINPLYEQRDLNGVYIHTFWLEPGVYSGNKFLKDGIYMRWCQNKILDCSNGFPYQDGRLPFVFFQHIPSATTIWPDTTVNQIRQLNLEVDKTTSQLVESKDYMANPMWRIPTQSKVKGQIKAVAGGIIRYVHVPNVPPPEPIQGLEMPAQVESLLAGLREQILDISGQSEVSRGRVPTGVRSGVAVAYLQEEDDTKLGPTVLQMEEAIAVMGSMTLERIAQFYTQQRTIRFYKPDGQFDVIKFRGTDLKNNTDVLCQSGSAMPKMKAARQQYTLELVSLGILTDPKEIKDELDLGAGEPDNDDKNRAQADRENNIMLHGLDLKMFTMPNNPSDEQVQQTVSAAVPVKAWQNHQLHIERHTSQMMEEEFDQLQIKNPGIARLFDEHVAMHQQFIQAQQQQQMQLMQAAKGAPEGTGGMTPNTNGNGAPPAPSGFTRQMSPVPDIIGGGVTQLTTRVERPTAGLRAPSGGPPP